MNEDHSSREKSNGDDEVGYGKPPKRSQFQPGRSGNPRGRPKSTKNLKTDLLEELAERVAVREDGRPREISKQRAIVKKLIASAFKGDATAMRLLFSTMRDIETSEAAKQVESCGEDHLADELERLLFGNVQKYHQAADDREPPLDGAADEES